MSETVRVGVDIGGTKVAFALVDDAGVVLARHRIPTAVGKNTSVVLDHIAQGIRDIGAHAQAKLTHVGVGCPGYVDMQSGVVRNSVNLNWREVPLRDELKQRLPEHYTVQVTNDVNAQLLGEVHFGAARGKRDVAYISIGTGLGGAAWVNGELLYGGHFASMEIGHIPLDTNGRACTCGQAGCPEMYVSGIGLINAYDQYHAQFPESPLAAQLSITTVDIIKGMQLADPLAERIRSEVIDWLVRTLVICDRTLNPEMIIIGGGLGDALLPLIIDDLRDAYAATTLANSCPSEAIRAAEILETAIGATRL